MFRQTSALSQNVGLISIIPKQRSLCSGLQIKIMQHYLAKKLKLAQLTQTIQGHIPTHLQCTISEVLVPFNVQPSQLNEWYCQCRLLNCISLSHWYLNQPRRENTGDIFLLPNKVAEIIIIHLNCCLSPPSHFFFYPKFPSFIFLCFSHPFPLSLPWPYLTHIWYMALEEEGKRKKEKKRDLTNLWCMPPDKIKTPQWIRCSMLCCGCCCHQCWGFWRCIWNCLSELINRVFGRQWEFAGHNLTQWGCAWVPDSEKFD